MGTKKYIVCKSCGHKKELDKELFVKILGGAVTGFGFWAWVSFLFAGTGFALPICVAIIAGGPAIISHADTIVAWMNKKYPCPKCGGTNWSIKTAAELEQIRRAKKEKRKAEEARDREEEAKRKAEEARRREEEEKRKAEEARNREADAKRKAEEARRREEEERRKAEEARYLAQNQALSDANDKIDYEKQLREREQQITALTKQNLQLQAEMYRSKYAEVIQKLELAENNQIMEVDQLREAFYKAFEECASELDIYVPFLGTVFKSDKFVQCVHKALKKGVIVKIRSGLDQDSSTQHFTDDMRKIIDKFTSDTRINKFAKSNQIRFHPDDSHAKLMIVDDKYYIIGSMNFLSNKGEDSTFNGKERKKWNELGEKSSNKVNLSVYRSQFFNF